MKYDTIREAAEAWVDSFNAIPSSVIEKLYAAADDDLWEITPPAVCDRVYDYISNAYGEIIDRADDDYTILLDNGDTAVRAADDFSVERDSTFPMWGTMWAFGNAIDDEWLDGEYLGSHVQEMADCGFRIYESEDYGHVFGIDGAGYNFYEAHWIPLYKLRGLKWHKEGKHDDHT